MKPPGGCGRKLAATWPAGGSKPASGGGDFLESSISGEVKNILDAAGASARFHPMLRQTTSRQCDHPQKVFADRRPDRFDFGVFFN